MATLLDTCPDCDGRGTRGAGHSIEHCHSCGGAGVVVLCCCCERPLPAHVAGRLCNECLRRTSTHNEQVEA